MEKQTTPRTESLRSTLMRWGLNFFPAYLSTAAKVTFLSADYQEVHLKIPHNWRTRDNNGELFKGTQYAAVDPVYPMLLSRTLGDDYSVREEEATIRFLEPARGPLFVRFELTEEDLKRIKNELEHHDSVIRVYKAELTSEAGTIMTEVEKTLTIEEAPQC